MKPRELRCYDYVNCAYASVRIAVQADAGGILNRASQGVSERAREVAVTLKVDLGALEVGTGVTIHILGIEETDEGPHGHNPLTRIRLSWKAAKAAAIFPSMEAELTLYPLSTTEDSG